MVLGLIETKQRKNPKFVHDDFGYHRYHRGMNYDTYYCEKRNELGCKAKARLFLNTNAFEVLVNHNHQSVPGNVQAQIVKVGFIYIYIVPDIFKVLFLAPDL
jgi:hypothetical protein